MPTTPKLPINKRVIVDGSNLATEGRNLTSFAQLKEALKDFKAEFSGKELTVVVDATFEHRIDASEHKAYEKAEQAGELITPPAGAIGRGDIFILRIAEKVGASVLSNDSFQEFHGEHSWLFDEGRLVGGKPVPGIGWVFTLRTPVRGPKSRMAVRDAKRRTADPEALASEVAARRTATASTRRPAAPKIGDSLPPKRADQTGADDGPKRGRRRRRSHAPAEALNTPMVFLEFVMAHPVKSKVTGIVDTFSSHGAYLMVDAAKCYIPLDNLAEPAPKSARHVLRKGDQQELEVVAFDTSRRGIELAVPGVLARAARKRDTALVDEVAAIDHGGPESDTPAPVTKVDSSPSSTKKSATKAAPKKTVVKKVAVKKVAVKKAVAKKATAKKAAPAKVAAKKAAPKKAAATKSTAKKATAAKVGAKAAPKKAAAKKAVTKKAATPKAGSSASKATKTRRS